MWNIKEIKEEFTLNRITNSGIPAGFSRDGNTNVSGSNSVRALNIQEKQEVSNVYEKNFETKSFEFLWNDSVIVSEPGPQFSLLQNELLKYQKLNKVHVKIDREFFNSLNQLSPQFTNDSFFQEYIKHKYTLNRIQENKLEDLTPELHDIYFTSAMYRPAHVAAFRGNKDVLRKWLFPDSNLIFRADSYAKSPFFYSIIRRNQECTQILMEYLITLRPKKKSQLEASMHSIRNDFQLIIKTSSSLLPEFINRILLQSDYVEVPETQEFPYLKIENVFTPNIDSFKFPKDSKKMPAIIKYTAFSIDAAQYSLENISMLETIRDCKNNKIFECSFIREYINYNWNGAIYWVGAFSVMQIFTISAFIIVLVGRSNWYLYLLFALLYFLLFVWEILQIVSVGLKNYFKDYWNYFDSITPIVIIYWFLSNFLNFNSEYESYLVAIMLMIRGLTAFKAVSGTRYYVRLIMASLNDIKFFLIVFFYSTLFFSVIITIAQNDAFDFETLWNQSWDLNFGGEIEMNKGNQALVYITVVVARILNVVLMLNMLISILGDSYDNFLLEKHIIDYREKLGSVIEIQKMMFFKRVCGNKQYLHFLVPPYEDNQDIGDWQGKILYMEKKQEKKMQALSDKISEFEYKNNEKFTNVENKIVGVENKIENKINGVENKIENLEAKINIIDSNMQKILELVSRNKS